MVEEKKSQDKSRPRREKVIDIRTSEKKSVIRLEQYRRFFAQEGWELRRNTITDAIECNGKDMTDTQMSKIRQRLRELDDGGKQSDLSHAKRVEDAVNIVAAEGEYHPISMYLLGCEEVYFKQDPKTDWFQKMCDCFVAEDPAIFAVWLKRWMIGCVARIFDGFQNHTLVFKGEQGLGKSYWAKWLCSGLDKMLELPVSRYFQEGAIDPSNNDHIARLASKWIWVVDEIGGTMSKRNRNELKEFLTKSEVSLRLPYGRFPITKPRCCSIVGSTNDDDFLDDPTGSRRYLVAVVNDLKRTYSSDAMCDMHESVDVDGLWGQIMCMYRAGEPAELMQIEKDLQKKINRNFEKSDPMEDWLKNNYESHESAFTASELILSQLNDQKIIGVSDRKEAMRLSDSCKRLGFARHQEWGGRRLKGYKVRKITPLPLQST
jgi:predicted P-loop ATPase